MKKQFLLVGLSLLTTGLISCGSNDTSDRPTSTETAEQPQDSGEKGTLALVANGEDFVRQGFVSKDGWQINFDHAYVTLADVTAYQTEPPFDPEGSEAIKATNEVVFVEEPQTIDLAEGSEDAEPIEVVSEEAPTGDYNALAWKVVEATEGEAAGNTIVLDGTAEKDGQTIDFIINMNQPLAYTCGEFVGDERKGIVEGTDPAELETTFHFDHIFGDADADEAFNQDALGFDPLATLAQSGTLEVDQATLEEQLAPEEYEKLQTAIAGLGHVGEGHCRIEESVAALPQ